MKQKLFFLMIFIMSTVIQQASSMTPTGSCDEFRFQMQDAIKRIDEMFAKEDVSCLPSDLENMIRERLGDSTPIYILCNSEKPKSNRRVYNQCKMKYEIVEVSREGGVPEDNWTMMSIYGKEMLNNVDELTPRIFHELIHIAENYYKKTSNNPEYGTKEDYTYTCTKQCFPNAPDCPGRPISLCKKCNEYKNK